MLIQCPSCAQWLEVPGRAATCPNCGALVTIPVSPPPPGPGIPGQRGVISEPAPRYTPPNVVQQMPDWVRATIIIGLIGLLAFSVIFFMIWRISVRLAGPTTAPIVAPTPPPPPPPTPASTNQSIFSMTPTPPPPPPAPPEVEETPPPPKTAPPVTTMPAPATRANTAPRVKPAPIPQEKQQALTDHQINAAILRGAEFLMSRFENGKLREDVTSPDRYVGTNALCVLALLHAGQAVVDERLNVRNPFLSNALDQLREMKMPDELQTYTRSLRAQALAVYNRQSDRAVLTADTRWLVSAGVRGAYTYREPPDTATQPEAIAWDNSNSQYGALGVWAAAEAGILVPLSYWQDVQTHWERSQTKDGGWVYRTGDTGGTLAMTAAGVNMLFVANEMISAQRPNTQIARPPFSPHLQAGLDWLATGKNGIDLSGSGYYGYTLYGLERAGLASGFKMLGAHDWYRVLATEALQQQNEDGRWIEEVDTAFVILFLARGRHPLMMNKLHFIGPWANRPRDLAKVAKFTSRETERALNWQVVSMKNHWSDWLDAPILYLASHEAPIFDDSDFEKLAAFVRAGGLLFTNADGDSKEFNQWAEILAMRIFDGQELQDLPDDHFIYTALFRPKEKLPLRGISNATRTLMIHSPNDIAKRWHGSNPKADRPPFEIAANMFIYATGMSVPRNRLDTLAVDEPSIAPSATIPIARLKHSGDWDPEPGAWERHAKVFRRATNIALQLVPTESEKLSTDVAPIAHLSATSAFSLTDPQIAAIQSYVKAGGVLLIDPCGGGPPVAQSIRDNILSRAFPNTEPKPLKPEHPLVAGASEGMTPILKPQARPYVFSVIGQKFTHPSLLESGSGAVITSELDITSGLLGTSTLGILGYEPTYSEKFISNLILWTLNSRGGAPKWSTTQPAKNN